jgi:hypothetical protein
LFAPIDFLTRYDLTEQLVALAVFS